MSRITLTDGSGKWFSSDAATKFDEKTRWNGNNHISCATGSQWEHESLYYTRSGCWILRRWSQWQGSLETYEEIDRDEAVRWLACNECWNTDELPTSVRDEVESCLGALEM